MKQFATVVLLLIPVACAKRGPAVVSDSSHNQGVFAQSDPGADRLRAAHDHFSKAEYREAIAQCDDVIAAHPDAARAYLLRGVAYLVGDNIRRGVADFDEAFRLNAAYWRPESAGAVAGHRLETGAAVGEQGRSRGGKNLGRDRSLERYTSIVRGLDSISILKPRYADAFAARGRAHEREGDAAGAIRCCTEAIRLNPELARAYVARGNALLLEDRFDSAFADYRSAVHLRRAIAPMVAETCRRRGLAERAKGNDAAAHQCLDAAAGFVAMSGTRG